MSRQKHKHEPGKNSRHILEGYLDGIRNPELREDVQAWLVGEHRAEERWVEFEKLFNERVTESSSPSAKAIEARERINRILGFPEDIQTIAPVAQPRPLFRRMAIRVAAVLIPVMLVVGAALFLNTPGETDIQETETASAVFDTIRCEADQVEKVVLACGSAVTLHDKTLFTFDDRRNATLVGEAFFDIEKDEEPFVLTVDDLTLTVLGTEFIVTSNQDADQITVSLYSGLLLVEYDKFKHELKPGETFSANKRTGEYYTSPLDTDAGFPDWVATESNAIGKAFVSVTFRELLGELESRYGVTVDNCRPELGGRRYSFEFVKDESLEEVLKTLKMIYDDFGYRINGNTVIIE